MPGAEDGHCSLSGGVSHGAGLCLLEERRGDLPLPLRITCCLTVSSCCGHEVHLFRQGQKKEAEREAFKITLHTTPFQEGGKVYVTRASCIPVSVPALPHAVINLNHGRKLSEIRFL